MKLGYSIVGSKQIQKKLLDFSETSDKRAKEAVFKAAALVHGTAVKSIQSNNKGELAFRYSNGRRRAVVVSEPGKPPNTDTGRLVQSIKMEFLNNGLEALVGTNLKYGVHLEFGTKRMAPRPWLSAALKKTKKQVLKIFQTAFEKSKKDAVK
jgi:HK97 gp10 family phage protein